jgi:hypothetical protein
MVAARGRDDAGRRHVPGQQVREGAARLERARMLEEFELERDRPGRQPEIGEIDIDRRRMAQIAADHPLGFGDALAGDRAVGGHASALLIPGLTCFSNLAN